ncbi:glycosyltransferase [Natronospirillum operosum]|uniref:Glycosyltransferase n=1 Tax=Natronospirillum operosum TaxID=2759953 RepID=A0A4Z0WF57_9GAMM|nr:glycosyltransferase [Natronospirillum operosum]TGG95258.1 glycosyltransferase [Natronospirillum operosum]
MRFSVLISIYCEENPEFLSQALLSIWDNQNIKPNQIVLVKDGPLTPDLNAEIGQWQNKLGDTLVSIQLAENVGLGAALNAGLEACEHELVARMDTDDVSMPERFEKQVRFMQAYPDVTASSAGLEEWSEDLNSRIGKRTLPVDPELLKIFAKKRSPLSHPLAMYRKSAVLAVGGYPPLRKSQDYALWSLLLVKGYKLANLPDVLLKMRTGDDFFVRRGAGFLKHELALLRFQKEIGFLNMREFLINCLLKSVLRLSPSFFKKFAYRNLR